MACLPPSSETPSILAPRLNLALPLTPTCCQQHKWIGAAGTTWEKWNSPFYVDFNIYVFNWIVPHQLRRGWFLTPQTESGDAAAVTLLLTTRTIRNRKRTVRKKLLPIFDFHGMIIFFNYLLTTRPHLNCYLSPQTECGDTAAVALLLTTKVNRDSERKVRTNVFLIFYLDIIIYFFQLLTYAMPMPWFISQPPDWIWRCHGCRSTANNNKELG